MRLELIKDKLSPFSHIAPRKYTNGRRYSGDDMKKVTGELLDALGLSREISSLEVGAGHHQEPSKALRNLGVNTTTLDLDWNGDFCTKIPLEGIDRLGESQLYPMLASEPERQHYLGDICYIGDERSELRDKRFDLLFYWGSVQGTGFCSSISCSENTGLNFQREVSLKERLESPIPNVSEKGFMAEISGFFNATGDPHIHPKNVLLFGGYMIDTLLAWLNNEARKPEEVIVFGLSKDRARDYIREQVSNEVSRLVTDKEIEDSVNQNRIEFMANKHASIFSDRANKDSSGYRKALEVLAPLEQRAIVELGMIDCVAVKYND